MYLALCPSDIRDFSVEQLQHIPKVILLRVYGDYIEHVWDKLPEYMKADSEVRNLSSLRRALQSTVTADAHRRPCTEDIGL